MCKHHTSHIICQFPRIGFHHKSIDNNSNSLNRKVRTYYIACFSLIIDHQSFENVKMEIVCSDQNADDEFSPIYAKLYVFAKHILVQLC